MLFYTNISYTTFVYTSKGGLPMNIDKLIHEYYDKINELKHDYKHNADDKKCNFQIKCTIPQGFRTFFITSLFALFISFTVFLFIYEFKKAGISVVLLFIDSLILSIWDNTKQRRTKIIEAQAKEIETRVFSLIELLHEHGISLSYENIEELIQAANENKPNHSHIEIIKRFTHLVTSGIAYYIPILIAIIFCDSFIEELNLHISEVAKYVIYYSFFFFIYLISFSITYCYYISDIDPHIRRIYHFHDIFVHDLRQLICFSKYYGLDKQENEKSSSESETITTEKAVSKENPIQNINIEATVEKKKAPKNNPKQKEEKNKKKKDKKKNKK